MSEGIRIASLDKQLEKAERLLSEVPGGARQALSNAINRSLEASKTAAVRAVTAEYTIKQKDIKRDIQVKRSSPANLEAEIYSKGTSLPLSAFKHSPRGDTTGNKRKPIRVTVKKGGGAKLTQAFIWNSHIWERTGPTRLPIEKTYGPALPVMLNNEQVVDNVLKTAEETVDKRLDHEVSRILDGVTGNG